MNKALLFAGLVACGPAASDISNQNTTLQGSDELEAGRADSGHPAIGLVIMQNDKGAGICTGTLIEKDIVLVAAHCISPADGEAAMPAVAFFTGPGAAFAMDQIGSPAFMKVFKQHNIDTQTYNEQWNNDCSSQVADNAILHLVEPITDITPMKLATSMPKANATCTAVGFGTHTEKKTETIGQKRTGTEVVADLTEGRLETEKGTAWTNEGDSGGPLLCNDQIAGTVSCGNATEGVTAYSRIDIATDWIAQAIEQVREAAKSGTGSTDSSSSN